MKINLWGALRFLRDLINLLPSRQASPLGTLPKPDIRYAPVSLDGAKGNALDVSVFTTDQYNEWRADEGLRALLPDPTNSLVLIFSGADADQARRRIGLSTFA